MEARKRLVSDINFYDSDDKNILAFAISRETLSRFDGL